MKAISIVLILCVLVPAYAYADDYALQFSIGNYVEVPDSDVWAFGGNDFTITGWIGGATSGNNTIIGQGSDWYYWDLEVGAIDSDTRWAQFTTGCKGVDIADSVEYSHSSSWHSFAVRRRGGDFEYYFDGIKYADRDVLNTANTHPIADNAGPLFLGVRPYGGSGGEHCYNGYMDDIGIWNYALSEQEIRYRMQYAPTGPTNGLLAYWNFNEGSGTVLHDLSGNGYHGAISGAQWIVSGVHSAEPDPSVYQNSNRKKYIITIKPDVAGAIYYHYLDEDWGGQDHGRVDKEVMAVVDADGAIAFEYYYHDNSNVVRKKCAYEIANYSGDPSNPSFSNLCAIYEYDTDGNVAVKTLGKPNADGELLYEYEYEPGTGNLKYKHAYEDVDKKKKFKDYEYDENGNVIREVGYKTDWALHFDGNDHVLVSDSDAWAFGNNDFTLTARVNFNTLDAYMNQSLLSQGISWNLEAAADDECGGGWAQFYGSNFSEDVYLPMYFKNTWYTIAMVKKGDMYTYYCNGVPYPLFLDRFGDQSCRTIGNSGDALFIGAKQWGGPDGVEHGLQGDLGGIGIWNYAFTEEEVLSRMRYAPTRSEGGLEAYWSFDGSSDTVFCDASGNGHDGIIYGAQWVKYTGLVDRVTDYYISGHKKSEWASDADGNGYNHYEYLDEDYNGTGRGRVSKKEKTDGSYESFEYWDNTEKVKAHKKHDKNGNEIERCEYDSNGRIRKKVFAAADSDGARAYLYTYYSMRARARGCRFGVGRSAGAEIRTVCGYANADCTGLVSMSRVDALGNSIGKVSFGGSVSAALRPLPTPMSQSTATIALAKPCATAAGDGDVAARVEVQSGMSTGSSGRITQTSQLAGRPRAIKIL